MVSGCILASSGYCLRRAGEQACLPLAKVLKAIGFQHLVMEHQSVQKLMFELRPGSFFTKKFSIE